MCAIKPLNKRSSKVFTHIIAALGLCLGAALGHAQTAIAAPPSPAIEVTKLEAGEVITLDGKLNHPAWQRAKLYDHFTEREPKNGGTPTHRTTVRVLINEQALYFGIEAFDSKPEKIRAPMVRHDGVNRTQDFVVVYVDAVGARKAAQFFRVSASSSTADGLHTAENDNEDFAPDFDFDAAASIDAAGYTAVLRIPFASLRYSAHIKEAWKMMVARRVPRDQTYLIASVVIPAEVSSFIATMQPLEGVSLPEHKQFLVLRPTLALNRSTQDGITESKTKLGAEIKWRPAAEWVVDATINPDFSQVELDVPQLSRNTRFAQALTEKRPFFLESSDLLQSPTSAIYTRSFTQPRWGARVNWRGESAAGTGLVLNDEGGGTVLLPGPFATGYADQPAYHGAVMRLRMDDNTYTVGMLASERKYIARDGDNTVIGIDVTAQISSSLKLRTQLLTSSTSAQPNSNGQLVKAETRTGNQFQLSLNHRSEEWEAAVNTLRTSRDYRNDSGFTSQSDARELTGNINRIWRNVDSPAGQLNEFWIYLWASRTDWLAERKTISSYVTPGIFIGAGRNTEITLEYRGWDWVRLAPDAALHRQDHAHIEYAVQPASWWTKFSLIADPGRLIDYTQDKLRPGVKYTLSSQFRVHRLLELEPQISQVTLRGSAGEERIAYRESAAQLLAVLHLSATQKLRYIGQQTHFSAVGIAPDTRNTHSLTYSWRKSAGTIAYLGYTANRGAQPGVYSTRGNEWFAKLQIDPQEFWR